MEATVAVSLDYRETGAVQSNIEQHGRCYRQDGSKVRRLHPRGLRLAACKGRALANVEDVDEYGMPSGRCHHNASGSGDSVRVGFQQIVGVFGSDCDVDSNDGEGGPNEEMEQRIRRSRKGPLSYQKVKDGDGIPENGESIAWDCDQDAPGPLVWRRIELGLLQNGVDGEGDGRGAGAAEQHAERNLDGPSGVHLGEVLPRLARKHHGDVRPNEGG